MNKTRIALISLIVIIPGLLMAIDKPDFSNKRNFYDTTFHLQLTADVVGGTIKYTLDGSKPDRDNGTIYSSPIEISGTSFVRAVSLTDDSISKVRTHSFIFLGNILQQDDSGLPTVQHSQDHVYWTEEFDMSDVTQSEEEIKQAFLDIPSISIVAPYDSLFGLPGILRGQNLREGSGGKSGDPNDPNWIEMIECSAEMIYPENKKFGEYKNWQENTGIKVQGGGGRWNNGYYDHKQSFTLEFKSRYGKGTLRNDIFKAAPFNREITPDRYDKIILRAGHNKSWGADWDRENSVYTRDQFGRDLQMLMSEWGSLGTFVHLYINGKYWGLYNPSERMDDNAMSIRFGGEDDDYYFGKGKGGDQSGNDDRYDYLRNTTWTGKGLDELSEYLAIDEYIDMCLLHCYANPGDGPQYYFGNRNVTPGPTYFTAWDIEDSFDGGSRRTGPPIAIENMSLSGNDEFQVYFKVKNNIDFKMKFADRANLHCSNGGILTDEFARSVWDSLNHFIDQAILCEIARWGDERGSLYDYDHWQDECQEVWEDMNFRGLGMITRLKNENMFPLVDPPQFLDEDQALEGDSVEVDSEFQLTIEGAGYYDIIYYTTDGSDPRAWDMTGDLTPEAAELAIPLNTITINDTTLITARCKNGSTWSTMVQLWLAPDSVTTSPNSIELTENAASDFILYQNYPNPFSTFTTIPYYIIKPCNVIMKIYDISGQEVETLVKEFQETGHHKTHWQPVGLMNNVYILQLHAGELTETRKIILNK